MPKKKPTPVAPPTMPVEKFAHHVLTLAEHHLGCLTSTAERFLHGYPEPGPDGNLVITPEAEELAVETLARLILDGPPEIRVLRKAHERAFCIAYRRLSR